MVSGFIIVRQLSINEYAYYTIANTFLGAMTLLSDCGVNTSVYALGAQNWRDKKKMGIILHRGLQLRTHFAFYTLIISVPVLIYLLFQQHASGLSIGLIILSIIPSFYAGLSDAILEVVPKLNQELNVLQKNQTLVAILRLFLVFLAAFIFPFTSAILLANGLPRIFGNIKLKKIALKNAEISNVQDEEVNTETKRIIKRTAPSTIYFVFSSQVSLFILSFLGKTTSIAQLGALGRFSVIFTVFTTFVNMVFIPRFARSENKRSVLLKKSHFILLLSLIGSISVGSVLYIFRSFVLRFLGTNYQHLDYSFLLIIIQGIITVLSSNAYEFNLRKGWVIHPLLDILISLVPTVVFAILIPLNTLPNVVLYGILNSLVYFLSHYFAFIVQLFQKADKD